MRHHHKHHHHHHHHRPQEMSLRKASVDKRPLSTPWPEDLRSDIRNFDRHYLKPSPVKWPSEGPNRNLNWYYEKGAMNYFRANVCPQIRAYNMVDLRIPRGIPTYPRTSLAPMVLAAIRAFDRKQLNRLTWSPYAGTWFLKEIRRFDHNLMRSYRPRHRPYALMYDIVTFDKSRLRSVKPRSPVKEELLTEIRTSGIRDLSHVERSQMSPAAFPEPRNWSLWALRQDRKLPAELQIQIQRAWAYPNLRHVEPITRRYFSEIPDIYDMRAKSAHYPRQLLADIRDFSRFRFRHVVPAVKQAPLEKEGLRKMTSKKVDKGPLFREITNFQPAQFKKRHIVPQVKTGIVGAEGRTGDAADLISWGDALKVEVTTSIRKEGTKENQRGLKSGDKENASIEATKVTLKHRPALAGRSMPGNWA
jgi:hypothetical protein